MGFSGPSFMVKLPDLIESPLRDSQDVENVSKWKEIAFMGPESSLFDATFGYADFCNFSNFHVGTKVYANGDKPETSDTSLYQLATINPIFQYRLAALSESKL
jgi:hypothetical protein